MENEEEKEPTKPFRRSRAGVAGDECPIRSKVIDEIIKKLEEKECGVQNPTLEAPA